MPRYFFHLRDKEHLNEDREGIDLPNLHSVLDEAMRVNHELAGNWNIEGLEFEITDDQGRIVLRVPVHDNVVRSNRHLIGEGRQTMEIRSKNALH